MEDKIVKVYVLKGLNGTSLVIENYRVSNEKIYGMLTPIYTFEVSTDDILQAIGIPTADVIERAEYDELNEKYFKAIHNHTECLKKLHELRSKIDKAIEEITKLRNSCNRMVTEEATLVNECYKQYANCYDECLKIIKQNIGE